MAFIKQQLLATLAELVEEDLRTFQFYLYNNEVEGFERIPKGRVHGLDREQTVDVTVQTYGYKGAVTVAVGILRKMSFNLFAEELEEKCKEVTSSQAGEESENNPNQEGQNSTSKEKYQNICEGNIVYLKYIYTELHVTDGVWKGVIKEHEVIQQMGPHVATEKTPEKDNHNEEKQTGLVTIPGVPAGETKC